MLPWDEQLGNSLLVRQDTDPAAPPYSAAVSYSIVRTFMQNSPGGPNRQVFAIRVAEAPGWLS